MSRSQKIKTFLRKSRILSFLFVLVMMPRWMKGKVGQDYKKALDFFVSEGGRKRPSRLRLFFEWFYYAINFDEYFLMDFEHLNHKGKKEYIGDQERVIICDQLATKEAMSVLNDKFTSYQTFRELYGREMIKISSESDRGLFMDFVERHEKVVIKPLINSFGRGVHSVSKADSELETEFSNAIQGNGSIVEEFIVQAEELASFHPESVNTVRLATWFDGSKVTPIFALLRIGVGSSFVDNTSSGGMKALIDMGSGITITEGIIKNGKAYLFHPDTGKQIIGFQLPRWPEIMELADSAARRVPELPYISWDIALTENGWVIVEGNSRGQLGYQYCTHTGERKRLERIFNSRNGVLLKKARA